MDKERLSVITDLVFRYLMLARDNIIYGDDIFKKTNLSSQELDNCMSKYPMPNSHIRVLIYIAQVKSTPVSHISSNLNMRKSNTTPIIDKLITYGLVHRYNDKNDRRIVRVELTERAKSIIISIENSIKQRIGLKISSLSDEDLIDMESCMEKLINIFLKLR